MTSSVDDTTISRAQPAIPFVELQKLDPDSRAFLEGVRQAAGVLPNSLRTHFHRPAIAKAALNLSRAIHQDPDAQLPEPLKNKLGIICSTINGCAYCTSHQCSIANRPTSKAMMARSAGLDDDQILALASGQDRGRSPLERACFAYARAASFDPHSVTADMLKELQAVLTPSQIVELAFVVGIWKMTNTIHDSLHLPVEDGMYDGAALLRSIASA